MFTSQCYTGVIESTFKTCRADEKMQASVKQASKGHLEFGMGLVARNKVVLLGGAAILVLAGISGAHAQQTQESQDTPVLLQPGQPLPQDPVDASNVTMLDKLTFITRTEEAPINTLASVSHISGEALELRMPTTPQDIFFGVPGIAVQSDSKRSLSTINIRGLQDFGRVAVIVDGARQNFQRSGHGTQSVFWIDPELVKQVDVIRGPVANTYGSGAIGGVVNFETKDAIDFLRDGETWAASATARYETNGNGWTTSATGAYSFSDAFDMLGNIVYRDYGDYTDGGGQVVRGTGFDVLSGMLKSTIRPTENSELKLGWIGSEDSWTEGVDTYSSTLKQNTLTARYNITDEDNSWLDLHINGAVNLANLDQTYLKDVRQFNSETGLPSIVPAGSKATYDLDTTGLDIWNTSRFETGALAHELTYGGDWLSDDINTTAADGGANVYTPSGKRTVWGLHLQDKVTYEWLEVIGGLRYDSYSLDDDDLENSGNRLSPRITVGVSPFTNDAFKGLQVYSTYAEGYRSPSVTETLMSGFHPNGVAFPFLPNPNLKPETGKTWEVGVNYQRDGLVYEDDSLRLKAAYFNNDVSDYIGSTTLSAHNPTSGCPFFDPRVPICSQYQNFANAKINGVEMEAMYDAGYLFAGLSASVTNGYTVSYKGVRKDLATIPSSQVTASLGFRMLDNNALTFGGEVQYNGAPKGAIYAEDYTLVNVFANYQVNDNLRLDFRADNLFDVKYSNPLNATTTSIVYEPGLTVKMGATMRFGG